MTTIKFNDLVYHIHKSYSVSDGEAQNQRPCENLNTSTEMLSPIVEIDHDLYKTFVV